MPQRKDETKRLAIRDAVIADVIENGLGNSPVSRIAARAGVSIGTIYIYYPTKDDMLQSIYLEVKSLLHGAVMQAQSDADTSAARLRAMWFAMVDFFRERPMMFAFHEAIDMEQVLTKPQGAKAAEMAGDIYAAIENAVRDETLRPLPMASLLSLLIGPAIHMSRKHFSDGTLKQDEIEATFAAIWAGIAKQPGN